MSVKGKQCTICWYVDDTKISHEDSSGTVKLSMNNYIEECIKIYGGEIKKSAATPAKGTLFDDDGGSDAIPLDDERAEKFHHTTAKLLYA